jgi:hypothetical protein
MVKTLVKKCIVALHPLAPLIYKATRGTEPYLCIITPVFDPALEPLRLLIGDLQRQSFKHFLHVSISNGPSPQVRQLIDQARRADARFIYDEIEFSETPEWQTLLMNLARRRTYAMRKYRAARYMFIDADSALASDRYLAQLYVADAVLRKDVIVTQTRFAAGTVFPQGAVLPLFPVGLGRIDITNYTFSHRIAARHEYPPDIDPRYGAANDYRYFQTISDPHNTVYFPFLGVLKDARRSYRSVAEIWRGTDR